MKAVVTGGTGFVGKWLVDKLLEQGDDVILLVRNVEKIPESWKNKVRVIECTLEQFADMEKEEIGDCSGGIFYHLAWNGVSGQQRIDTRLQLLNVQFTCDAVRLAARVGCERFLNAGSIMEYEALAYVPCNNSSPSMGYIYSIAKLTADCMAKTVANQEKIVYVNAIISNIYGIGEKSARFFNVTMKKLINNEEVPLTHGKQLYDFIYVSDAVNALVLVGEQGHNNSSYYIGNSRLRPLKEFVEEMHFVLESKADLKFGEIPYVGSTEHYEKIDLSSLEKLGFVPQVSFEEGIRLTKAWFTETVGTAVESPGI